MTLDVISPRLMSVGDKRQGPTKGRSLAPKFRAVYSERRIKMGGGDPAELVRQKIEDSRLGI
jgi:hypothetical protein